MLTVACTTGTRELLAKALPQNQVSCVLIAPEVWGTSETETVGQLSEAECRELVALIQSHDVAAMVANDPKVAGAAGADGCHLDTEDGLEERYASARAALGPQAIIGVMPGPTRHTAMAMAEAGADYIGYSVSTDDGDDGLDRMQWWAEIFESPVVAFTDGNLATCELAIEAGPPDFLAVPLREPEDLAAIEAVAALIAERGALPIAEKNAK